MQYTTTVYESNEILLKVANAIQRCICSNQSLEEKNVHTKRTDEAHVPVVNVHLIINSGYMFKTQRTDRESALNVFTYKITATVSYFANTYTHTRARASKRALHFYQSKLS